MSERDADVVILGGGLVGMTLAIGLAEAGITSHVVDNSDPAAQTAEGFDGRASAISTAALTSPPGLLISTRSSNTSM